MWQSVGRSGLRNAGGVGLEVGGGVAGADVAHGHFDVGVSHEDLELGEGAGGRSVGEGVGKAVAEEFEVDLAGKGGAAHGGLKAVVEALGREGVSVVVEDEVLGAEAAVADAVADEFECGRADGELGEAFGLGLSAGDDAALEVDGRDAQGDRIAGPLARQCDPSGSVECWVGLADSEHLGDF